MNKKGLSPLISTSLLMLISIISLISFQNWFNSYETNIFTNIETKNPTNNNEIKILKIIDRTAYIKNPTKNNLLITNIKINNLECNIGSFGTNPKMYNNPLFLNKSSITSIQLSNCLLNSNSGKKEIFLELTDNYYNITSIYLENGSKIISNTNFYQKEDYNITKICQNKNLCDANCDGKITLSDMDIVRNIIIGTYGYIFYKSADCNNDTFINNADMSSIKYKVDNP